MSYADTLPDVIAEYRAEMRRYEDARHKQVVAFIRELQKQKEKKREPS